RQKGRHRMEPENPTPAAWKAPKRRASCARTSTDGTRAIQAPSPECDSLPFGAESHCSFQFGMRAPIGGRLARMVIEPLFWLTHPSRILGARTFTSAEHLR